MPARLRRGLLDCPLLSDAWRSLPLSTAAVPCLPSEQVLLICGIESIGLMASGYYIEQVRRQCLLAGNAPSLVSGRMQLEDWTKLAARER